jgi:hypothetical protein
MFKAPLAGIAYNSAIFYFFQYNFKHIKHEFKHDTWTLTDFRSVANPSSHATASPLQALLWEAAGVHRFCDDTQILQRLG